MDENLSIKINPQTDNLPKFEKKLFTDNVNMPGQTNFHTSQYYKIFDTKVYYFTKGIDGKTMSLGHYDMDREKDVSLVTYFGESNKITPLGDSGTELSVNKLNFINFASDIKFDNLDAGITTLNHLSREKEKFYIVQQWEGTQGGDDTENPKTIKTFNVVTTV